MGIGTFVCSDCGRRRKLSAAETTMLGRRVCDDCARHDGVAATMIASGGKADVGRAIATEGWLARLRRLRSSRRR